MAKTDQMAKADKVRKKTMKVRIVQTKSAINRSKIQKDTLLSLGITKLNRSVEKDLTPAVAGMIKKINHLISVTKI